MDYAYDYDYVYDSDQDNPNEDFELRKITVNPQPPPATSFVFVTGIQHPGAPEACRRFAEDFHFYYLDIQDYLRDLCDISSHDREAYGHLHTSAYEARFFDGLRDEEFVESPTFAFFLLPTLRWKIEREVGMGWSRFLIVGLERWLRVAREFISRIAEPVAVVSFKFPRKGSPQPKAVVEELFTQEEVVEVPVGGSAEETYGKMLAETIGKHGMPSSPSYSPSP